MNRSRHHRYRPFAACLLFAAALAVAALAAGTGEAQAVVKPKGLTSDLIQKKSDSVAPYVLRPKTSDWMTMKGDLNAKVLQYAESKMGQQVERGECWDLANQTLKSAGAKQPGQGGYGSYVFGQAVSLSSMKPGDILQFENVVFKGAGPNGGSYSNNFGHHTAIVRKVQGRQIELLHQNVNNDRRVQTGTINLDHKQAGGTLVAYRPQPR